MTGTATSPQRRRGISPWVPNQHGAWAMLITPAVVGVLAAAHHFFHSGTTFWSLLALVGVLVAWFLGYFTFFAFGLVAKARTPARRKRYILPVYVYGTVCLAGVILALSTQFSLIWWALFFGPLVAIACFETLRGRPRSTLSGVSTAVASALLVPVLVMVGLRTTVVALPAAAWVAGFVLGLFFSGSVAYVKSMIRERKNPRYRHGSIAYHVAALACTVLVVAFFRPGWAASALFIAGMVWSLVRSWYFPTQQAQGRKFTPKEVGLRENPPLLLVSVGALLACL